MAGQPSHHADCKLECPGGFYVCRAKKYDDLCGMGFYMDDRYRVLASIKPGQVEKKEERRRKERHPRAFLS